MQKLKLAYFGTPDFSGHFLEKILNDKDLPVEVQLVVTQPDQAVGRKQIITPSPVKEIAKKYNIEVQTGVPSKGVPSARSSSSSPSLAASTDGKNEEQAPFANIDLALLFAYGDIIPKDILSLPRLGFWNIHPSLLPRYRGASPIATPLILGDTKTGVTLMQMDEELDHGPIIGQEELMIQPEDKRPDLEIKLTDLAYDLFKKKIMERGIEVPVTNQDHNVATFTRRLIKEDGFIPFQTLKNALENKALSQEEIPLLIKDYYQASKLAIGYQLSAISLFNLFRGLYPWPGIWTKVMINKVEKRLKITDMKIEEGKLVLKKVQLEGKNEVDFPTFNQAYRIY